MKVILNSISISLNFLGSLAFVKTFFIFKKEAIELGVARYAGETDEENIKLPAVQERLAQKKYGIIGSILLALGFMLQIILLLI